MYNKPSLFRLTRLVPSGLEEIESFRMLAGKLRLKEKSRLRRARFMLQGMDSISAHCHHLLHVLATDVEQELEEAYPEELSRTPLRHTMFQRPNARARCRARKLMVHKYVHLTPIQRYERAQAHSRLLPRAIRLADFLVLGSMLDLSKTAVDVRSAHACLQLHTCLLFEDVSSVCRPTTGVFDQ